MWRGGNAVKTTADTEMRGGRHLSFLSGIGGKGEGAVPSGDTRAFSFDEARQREIRRVFARLETRRLPIDHRDRETNERVFAKKRV